MSNMTDDRRMRLFAQASTPMLIQAGLVLEAKPKRSTGERLALAWISDELERRGGGIADEEAFFEMLERVSYIEALLVTFPELVS